MNLPSTGPAGHRAWGRSLVSAAWRRLGQMKGIIASFGAVQLKFENTQAPGCVANIDLTSIIITSRSYNNLFGFVHEAKFTYFNRIIVSSASVYYVCEMRNLRVRKRERVGSTTGKLTCSPAKNSPSQALGIHTKFSWRDER